MKGIFLNKESIENLLNLYRAGYSLNNLSNLSGLPKTTIYYHTRKAFGRYYPEPYFNSKLEKELGEFAGAFAGDGNFYLSTNGLYTIRFYLSENEFDYAKHLSNLSQKIFGKIPNIWHDKLHHVFRVALYGKYVYLILKRYLSFEKDKSFTIKLKQSVGTYNQDFLKGFIRGLIATDGSVSHRTISFYTISKSLAKQYSKILSTFGIKTYIHLDKRPAQLRKRVCYQVHFRYNISNIITFHKFIGLTERNKRKKLEKALLR